MARQPISAGAAPNDGTGSTLRAMAQATEANFVELYGLITGLFKFVSDTDCSANPNYPAAVKGEAYVASVAGKVGGAAGTAVDVGDLIVARADNAGGTQAAVGASWFVLEHNLAGALADIASLSPVNNDFLQYVAGAWSNRTVAQTKAALGLPASADVQIFLANGLWTKPAFGAVTRVIAFAGGGGGGNGAVVAAATAASGGAGGGAGMPRDYTVATATLGATEAVTVGAGGLASAAGGNSTFGAWLTAYGGGGGSPGTAGAASAGGGSGGLAGAGGNAAGAVAGTAGSIGGAAGGSGAAGGGSNLTAGAGGGSSATGVAFIGGSGGLMPASGGSGGGGGGGLTAANGTNAGAASGPHRLAITGAAGGAAPGGAGTSVGAAPSGLTDSGVGGGGGASATAANGGAGGAGQRPGGGGGGGGSTQTGFAAGAGGVGGAGLVVVITW